MVFAWISGGSANGSSTIAYAAVLGRLAGGSDATHLAKGTIWFATGALTANRLGSFCANTDGAPPDPSTNA